MKSYLNQCSSFILSIQNKTFKCLKRKEVQLLLKGIQAFIFSARIKPLCVSIYVLKYNRRKDQKRLERLQLFIFFFNCFRGLHYGYSPSQNFVFLFIVTIFKRVCYIVKFIIVKVKFVMFFSLMTQLCLSLFHLSIKTVQIQELTYKIITYGRCRGLTPAGN